MEERSGEAERGLLRHGVHGKCAIKSRDSSSVTGLSKAGGGGKIAATVLEKLRGKIGSMNYYIDQRVMEFRLGSLNFDL